MDEKDAAPKPPNLLVQALYEALQDLHNLRSVEPVHRPLVVLRLLRYCHAYNVDFTVGVEATGARGEVTHPFYVPQPLGPSAGPPQQKLCRARYVKEGDAPVPKAGSPYHHGTEHFVWIPDGDIEWTERIIGLLQYEIQLHLEAALEQ